MAKIRGIKPETWTDDKFVQLSPLARLLFIGMWNYACDNGHVEDNAVQLKMRLLPMDACHVPDLIEEMVTLGQVVRQDGWLKVVNLVEHQKAPDKRFLTLCEHCEHDEHAAYMDADKLPRTASKRRAKAGDSSGARRATAEHTPSTRGAHAGDGDGEVDGDVDGEGAKPRKRACQLPSDFRPTDKHIALAAELGVNLRPEWAKFVDHHRAKGSTFKDWSAALNNWIRKAAEYGNNVMPIRPAVGDDGQPVLPPLPLDDKR